LPVDPVDVIFVHGVRSDGRAWDTLLGIIREDPELSRVVRSHVFQYDTRLVSLRPDERIAEINDIADQLATYVSTGDLTDAKRLVIVTHSQGGLVALRFLVRMLGDNKGRELARIKRVCMYACPNTGSQFLLSLRKSLRFWSNPQEQELRPESRLVTETLRQVLRDVVNVTGCTANQCHILIESHGGAKDNIVPPHQAKGVFPEGRVVTGNHSTIIRPADRTVDSYQVLRQALLAVAGGEAGTESAGTAEDAAEQPVRVSVAPPFGRSEGTLHGRDDIVRAITTGTGSRVHVLAGLGGAGKSRIALEIADRAWRAGHQVWWIKHTRINGCMREVAHKLGIPETRIELAWRDGSPTDLIWDSLRERKDPWLLVFDNADEPQELAEADGRVSDATGWLRPPAGSNGTVIVTTRDGNAATWGPWCAVHQVRPLESGDGAAMLTELAPDGGTREEARLLSAELGGLPLALNAAARYVRSEYTSRRVWTGEGGIKDFSAYRTAVQLLFASAPGAPSARAAGEPLGLQEVRQVFQLSLDLLSRRGVPDAAPLLKLLACLGTDPVPYFTLLSEKVLDGSAVLANFTADRRALVLEGLADLGLIELDELPNVEDPSLSHVLSLHPVVHGIFRDDDDVRRRRADYYRVNIELLLNSTKDQNPDTPESWGVWPLLVPHTVEVCRSALLGETALGDQRVIAQALELARVTCRYLIVAGIIEAADTLITGIIANASALGYGMEDREILGLRHEKGRLAIERGDPEAAEAELRLVVAGRRRVLSELHEDTLASRHKLAKAILEQNRWAEAEQQLASIVEDERNVRGYDHPDTIVVRHSLARAIAAQGRFADAEARLREIREVQLSKWSPLTPETLWVQLTLARCLLDQERTAEAEREVRDALALIGKPRDVLVARQLQFRHTLAWVLLALGERDRAIEELTSVVAERVKMLGPDDPATCRARADRDRIIAEVSLSRYLPPSSRTDFRHTCRTDHRGGIPYTRHRPFWTGLSSVIFDNENLPTKPSR
jgi:tetratricopeptide (TPR) repeat protein/pimeloyl-ACP methyl ester carboxylesterase